MLSAVKTTGQVQSLNPSLFAKKAATSKFDINLKLLKGTPATGQKDTLTLSTQAMKKAKGSNKNTDTSKTAEEKKTAEAAATKKKQKADEKKKLEEKRQAKADLKTDNDKEFELRQDLLKRSNQMQGGNINRLA